MKAELKETFCSICNKYREEYFVNYKTTNSEINYQVCSYCVGEMVDAINILNRNIKPTKKPFGWRRMGRGLDEPI